MAYVAIQPVLIGGTTFAPGAQLDALTVDAWPDRDELLKTYRVKQVDDALVAQLAVEVAQLGVEETFSDS